jgi:anthranilate phosphoribosyltransferase
LRNLGSTDAWIVHGQGLDELTLAGENHVVSLKSGVIDSFTLRPEDVGLTPAPISAIVGGDAATNAAAMRAMLAGQASAYRDTVLFNTGAAMVVAGRAATIQDGVAEAAHSIDSGAAHAALDALIRETA